MKLLDAFCCAGGAATGYSQAGFTEITGVDLNKNHRKNYPFEFVLADAVSVISETGSAYDFIHASPPCQGYSQGNAGRETNWPKLIPATREALKNTGAHYVIENVAGARSEMVNPVELCGCMFDLRTVDTDGETIHLYRKRLFEASFPLKAPRPCNHEGQEWVAGAYGGARRDKYEAKYVRKGGYVPRDKKVVQELLGISHEVTWNQLFESIPPAYTKYIGLQFIEYVKGQRHQSK